MMDKNTKFSSKHIRITLMSLSYILLISVIAYLLITNNNDNRVDSFVDIDSYVPSYYLEYGDVFPQLTGHDVNGNTIKTENSHNKYTVYFYLDRYCGTCLEKVKIIDRFYGIYGDIVNVVVLWKSDIPTAVTEKHLTVEHLHISLDVESYLESSTPSYFLVGKDNNVIYIDNDFNNLLRKLNALDIDIDRLKLASNKYIINNFLSTPVEDKPVLVYFSMEGCQDCLDADPIFEKVKTEFSDVTIYFKNATDLNNNIDYDNIFLNIYGINWYPSFLIIEGDSYRFIGQTPINQLEEALMAQ